MEADWLPRNRVGLSQLNEPLSELHGAEYSYTILCHRTSIAAELANQRAGQW